MEHTANDEEDQKPKVHLKEKFSAQITRDVCHAKVLTHERWGSEEAEVMDSLLDIHQPAMTETTTTTKKEVHNNCPATLLSCGGGFMEGSKEQNKEETSMAHHCAKRGFVVVAPNHRLTRH